MSEALEACNSFSRLGKFGRNLAKAFGAVFCPPIFDRRCAAFDPAEDVQSFGKSRPPTTLDSRRA